MTTRAREMQLRGLPQQIAREVEEMFEVINDIYPDPGSYFVNQLKFDVT
jgi:uncharacterized protein YqfB (UPF0267 family)